METSPIPDQLLMPSNIEEAGLKIECVRESLEAIQTHPYLTPNQRAICERGQHETPDPEFQQVFAAVQEFGRLDAILDLLDGVPLWTLEALGLFPTAKLRIQNTLTEAETIDWPQIASPPPGTTR